MGSLISPELNLDLPEKWVPGAGAYSSSETQNFLNLHDYLARLQDEMKKIEAFERELPLCMLLVKDEIARLKKEPEKSNCNPPFEEFLPLKHEPDEKIVQVAETENRDKVNWMSSVQLWNYGDHQIHESNMNHKKGVDSFQGKEGKDKNDDEIPLLSLCIPETNNTEQDTNCSGLSPKSSSATSPPTDATNLNSNPRISRKSRRCWSSELHRRFIDALQQLGGPQAATPKQIRDLMKVDDLTNDEVKSHLQKYRLHVRRGPTLSNDHYHKNIKRSKPQSLLPLVKSSSEDDNTSEINNH